MRCPNKADEFMTKKSLSLRNKIAFISIIFFFAGAFSAPCARARDLVNDNPYRKSYDEHIKRGGGYFKKESGYIKQKSAYFPNKSAYFTNGSPYVKNNNPNFIERFFNGVKSLLS